MTLLRMAARNLTRQSKRSFLLGGAIAFGVLVVTIINGLAGGFIHAASDNFSHLLAGHIFVEGREKTPSGKVVQVIRDDSRLLSVLEQTGINYEYLLKRSSFTGSLIFEGESVTLRIDGVSWDEERYLKERLILKEGSWETVRSPKALVLSEEMARQLGAVLGDLLLIQLETATGQQNVGEFVLAGIHYDPGLLSTVSAYASLATVSDLLNLAPGEYMSLGILLPDIRRMNRLADRYTEALLEAGLRLLPREKNLLGFGFFGRTRSDLDWQGMRYRVSTLNDYLSQLTQIINILNLIGLVILLILLFIIMVGITNTYRMIMYERTREIGTIRALGMQRRGVLSLFLLEALLLCLFGSAAGLSVAGIVMGCLSLVNWGLETPMFLFLINGHLRFRLVIWQVAGNVGLVSLLSLLGAMLPARKASRLEPVEALNLSK